MKGYSVEAGYMGFIGGKYILFESEDAYVSYFYETEEAA